MIDLHVHSTRSDGTLTPTELVDYAVKKGLSAFALTDHDTVEGLAEAIAYAGSLREKGISVPEVIPGIEFSTEHEGKDVHILGLFIDYKSPVFSDYLRAFIESRENRNRKMCAKMTAAGLDFKYEDLLKEYPDSVITRAHMARYMIKKGIVKSREEAFDRYIGDSCPFFLQREKVTPAMAVDLILKADGIPVLAHPMLYKIGHAKLSELTGMLKELGLIGIEGLYSTYTMSDRQFVRKLANKYHLLLSGGSDFHGANKTNIDLGTGCGRLNIPESILKELKERRKNILFTDMDGTLLLSDSTISAKMKEALDKAVENGHRLVLSSGRPLPSIRERSVALGINYSNSYIISFNGGLIYDASNDSVLRSIKLSSDIIRKVTALTDKEGVHAHCYTEQEIVGTVDDDELKYYRERIDMPFIKVDNIADFLTDGTYKIQIIDLESRKRLEKIQKLIENELSDFVDTCFSNDRYLEILPKGINKGDGVKFLTSYLCYPVSHTFGAGDENNDIPMLLAAGHGVAVQNAKDEVKAVSEIITQGDHNHDGLLEILEKYFV